jgi:formate--tetrahydrofolate ligase
MTALKEGIVNLRKQIENARLFGIPVVVAVNKFDTDTEREIDYIRKFAVKAGAYAAELSDVWLKGGEGGISLAEKVVESCDKKKDFKFLYSLNASIKEKIEAVATKIYGADRVEYSQVAEIKIKRYTRWGFANLPVCMAKTHLSLSHDPALKGAPKGFTLPVRDVRLSAGAGFIYPLCGEITTMPGLPSVPAGTKIDIDSKGNVIGLF